MFEHRYNRLKQIAEPILTESGYIQVSEEFHPEIFGSAYSEFVQGPRKVRLIWDGKDGWGYFQTLNPQRGEFDWTDVHCYLAAADISSDHPNRLQIDQFCVM